MARTSIPSSVLRWRWGIRIVGVLLGALAFVAFQTLEGHYVASFGYALTRGRVLTTGVLAWALVTGLSVLISNSVGDD